MAQEADLLIEAGFSDAKLAQEASRLMAKYKKAGEQAQKAFQDAQGAVGDNQKLRAHMREIDKLSRAYDPVYVATKKYEGAVASLEKALAANVIDQTTYTAKLTEARTELGRISGAVQDTTTKSVGFGNNMSNIGFQIGDFATQVGAGTSATQALGQQLPQLLGGFGAIGAVAGAAAAILIPLGAAILKTAFDSETLEERMKGLEASTDAMTSAAEAAAVPIEELRAKYGDLADEIARTNGAMASFAARRAQDDLLGASKATAGLFGDLVMPAVPLGLDGTPNADRLQQAERAQARALERLRRDTGATEDQMDGLVQAIRRLETANGVDAVARDSENLLSVLAGIAANADANIEKLGTFADAVAAVNRVARDQIEAQRAVVVQQDDVIAKYDATTTKLKDLAAERKLAEDAAKSASGERLAAANAAIDAIDREIAKTKELARQNDVLMDYAGRRAQAYQQYGATRGLAMGGQADTGALAIGRGYAGLGERPNREELKSLIGVDPATVAWCAAFMNAVLERAGSKGTGSLAARSFLDWGTPVQNPTQGDVVVLKRGNSSTAGHVGFYEGANQDGSIRVFGGNQGDRVGSSNYRASDVLGYRRAPEAERYVNSQTAIEEDRIRLAGVAAAEAEKETAKALREQITERERQLKAVKDYGAQLAQNLVTQEQQAALDRARSASLQAIEAAGLDGPAKAAAIAQVTAEYEKQRLVMTLTEDAKRRQVDLDTLMTGSTMTYAQAIAALGEARAANVIVEQQEAAEMERLAERQGAVRDINRDLNQTLMASVMAGDTFAQTLQKIGLALAEMAAQAVFLGEGPLADLFGITSGIFNFGGGGVRGNDALSQALRGAIGKRATGGPISANTPYLVGERGPEIIVPRSAGQVIPNNRIGGGGMTYSPVFHVGGRVTPEDLQAVRAEAAQGFQQMNKSLPSRVQTINRDPLRR